MPTQRKDVKNQSAEQQFDSRQCKRWSASNSVRSFVQCLQGWHGVSSSVADPVNPVACFNLCRFPSNSSKVAPWMPVSSYGRFFSNAHGLPVVDCPCVSSPIMLHRYLVVARTWRVAVLPLFRCRRRGPKTSPGPSNASSPSSCAVLLMI